MLVAQCIPYVWAKSLIILTMQNEDLFLRQSFPLAQGPRAGLFQVVFVDVHLHRILNRV